LDRLKERFDRMLGLRHWALALDETRVVAEEGLAVAVAGKDALQVPAALENKLRKAIADGRPDDVRGLLGEWLRLCFGAVHEPRRIVDGSVKLVSSMLQAIGETHGDDIAFERRKIWLPPVLEALTRAELTDAFGEIADRIAELADVRDELPYGLVVRKAIRLIRERYHDGLTLDEIASSLQLTPEYLSGLFAKETGTNFSAYLKDFRIAKAKALLLGSGLKMFEIARLVGYPDPKYFSRVFKEATGVTPAEFQKLNHS